MQGVVQSHEVPTVIKSAALTLAEALGRHSRGGRIDENAVVAEVAHHFSYGKRYQKAVIPESNPYNAVHLVGMPDSLSPKAEALTWVGGWLTKPVKIRNGHDVTIVHRLLLAALMASGKFDDTVSIETMHYREGEQR